MSENTGSNHLPLSSAKDLKAKLQKSAAKAKATASYTYEPVDEKRVQFTGGEWNEPIIKNESRLKALGAMTPRTQAHCDHVMETNVRRAVETQAQVLKALCAQGGYDTARSSLGGLRRVAPEVIELAEFWESALMIEKKDSQRAATCMYLAMENVTRENEKEALHNIIVAHLRSSGQPCEPQSLDDFFFPTTRRLSFYQASTSPQPPTSPVRSPAFVQQRKSPLAAAAMKMTFKSPDTTSPLSANGTPLSTMKERLNSIGKLNARLVNYDNLQQDKKSPVEERLSRPVTSLRSILAELPPSETSPATVSFDQEQPVTFEEPEAKLPEIARPTLKGTPYPRKQIEQARVLFASPAVRVPTPKKGNREYGVDDEEEGEIIAYRPMPRLQSRSPARAVMYLKHQQQQQGVAIADFETKGSFVVLSPVKESASSTKRVATPVRRSLRTATISTEEKNRDALVRSEYSYVPNHALHQPPVESEVVEVAPKSMEKLQQQEAETPGSVRRSARKVKFVERLSPRLNSKFHN